MAQNDNYIKYLSPSAEEEGWGLGVTTVGHAYYPPGAIYPASRHPDSHFFSPEQGRVLNEYQVLYVTDGTGWFRSKSMKTRKIGRVPFYYSFRENGTVIILIQPPDGANIG